MLEEVQVKERTCVMVLNRSWSAGALLCALRDAYQRLINPEDRPWCLEKPRNRQLRQSVSQECRR